MMLNFFFYIFIMVLYVDIFVWTHIPLQQIISNYLINVEDESLSGRWISQAWLTLGWGY